MGDVFFYLAIVPFIRDNFEVPLNYDHSTTPQDPRAGEALTPELLGGDSDG